MLESGTIYHCAYVCLSTWTRWPGGEGASSCQKKEFYDGFLLLWCNFKFEGVLFRSDSRHNDRVDCLCRPTGSTSFMAQVRGLKT